MFRHPHSILNHFSPLQRQSILRWLASSELERRTCHKNFLACLTEVSGNRRQELLDRRTQIAFSLLNEFGLRFAERRIYSTLIDAVETRHMNISRL